MKEIHHCSFNVHQTKMKKNHPFIIMVPLSRRTISRRIIITVKVSSGWKNAKCWHIYCTCTKYLNKYGTFHSLECRCGSVLQWTELSSTDWGKVHLDVPKAQFECSPRWTKPARRWRRRNPGDRGWKAEKLGRSQRVQVWNRTKDGGETKISLLCPPLYCLYNCASDRLLGCEGETVFRGLDFSQGRRDCLLHLWFLCKLHKSDGH